MGDRRVHALRPRESGRGRVLAAFAGPRRTPRIRLPGPLRRLRRRVFYLCVRSLVEWVRRAPRGAAVGVLRGLAGAAPWLRPRDVAVAREQIGIAWPERDAKARAALARTSLDRLAENLVDMVRRDADVRVDGGAAERLEAARRRGAHVVLMAHLGAWELVGPVLAHRLAPFAALTADAHNEWVDRWLRRERRARGITVFDRDREVRAAGRWLRDGGTLAVLADHRTRGTQVPAPWFGRMAPTSPGPGRLARLGHARILPVGIRREGRGHRLLVGEAFAPTGDVAEDARRCNAALEELVRSCPEEWTWIHDRYGCEPTTVVPARDGTR